jgi:hypothetical protein
MRTTFIVGLLVGSLIAISNAQFQKGDVELSFNGSLGSRSTSVSSKGYDDSQSYNFFYLGVCPGFFIAPGLSVEPEIAYAAIQKQFPSWYLLGNLSYTYNIGGPRVFPFLRAGYGVSNAILPIPGVLASAKISKDMNVSVLNFGGGIKYQLAGSTFLRTEINYKRYNWTDDYPTTYPPYSTAVDYTNVDFGLLIGLSLVL